jgi:hypothetical protein
MPRPVAQLAIALLVALAGLALPAGEPASADVLEHRATGFRAQAPADFVAHYRPATRTYVIASRRRDVALAYRLLRTTLPARLAGRVLARRAAADVVGERSGPRAFQARFANGRVMRVRRSGPGLLAVTRFHPGARNGARRTLLAQIRRSLRGGRPARLGVARRKAQAPRAEQPPASRNAGSTLLRSDFESGAFTGWYVQSLRERAQITPYGAFGSAHAARFEVRDGDAEPDTGSERSELSLSGQDLREGQDIYVRDVLRIPHGSAIGDSWLIVNQLHESDWGGSPGIAVFVDSGPSIEIGSGDGDRRFLDSTPLEYGRWHDLVYRVKLSRDPAVGFVEAWLDGTQLELANGEARIYGQTIQAARAYLKAGIYRGESHDGTTVIEHDDIAIGTTLEAVTGG